MTRALLLACLVLPAAACASAQAKAPAGPVALEVPPVPPRTIAALPADEPPEIEPVQPLPAQQEPPPPPRPRPQPRPSGNQSSQQTETKPEPAQEAAPSSQQPQTSTPVPPLRAPGTGDGPEAEREVEKIIARAEQLLQNIDYRYLSQERRVLYDSAKNFINQSQEAMKVSNLVLARSLAERAENTAKQLSGR
jgi:hypothetical protein